MLSSLGDPETCFLSRIKAFFIEHKGYNDLRHAAEGGHDAMTYLYAILLYKDNDGTAANDTAKGYMRWVAGGGSTTSLRWLSNEECLPLREKATRAFNYSTWRIWGGPLPPPAQVHGDQLWHAPAAAAAWKKGWLQISLFCSEDCRLRCKMVKFAQRIGNQ
jgi:hypothetical protein